VDGRVLIAEGDVSIRESAEEGLTGEGFRVTSCGDAREGLDRLRRELFDLAVLDVRPEGNEIVKQLRTDSRIPIVMLAARADVTHLVVSLQLGADDYVTKPFQVPVLVARCRAVLRRAASYAVDPTLRVGDLVVDPSGFMARKGGVDMPLTATEYRVLAELAREPGRIITRDALLSRVWDYEYLGDPRLVDVAVQRLRAKVEDDPKRPRLITTVRDAGYRLEKV
jgi:two-component system, OmpR family, response regulator MtrA